MCPIPLSFILVRKRRGKEMGLKVVDLLKWRGKVTLLDPETKQPLLNEKEEPFVVYVRVIGDEDMKAAFRAARLLSADIRKKMRDTNSDEFKERVEPIREA